MTDKTRNRLTDIVVEEVSLVDRAANKHRFLIVKRSDEMDDNSNQQVSENETSTNNNTESEEELTDLNEQSSSDADPDPDSPLTVALSALEGLTETVELLGSMDDNVATTRLATLAGDLKAVSDRLAQMSGADSQSDGQSQGAADTDPKKPDLSASIEAVQATLARVKTILDSGSKDESTDDKSDKPQTSGDKSVTEQLTAISNELRALTTSVKEQQQRLIKLEKRFGVPSSIATNEQRRRTETEDVGWPLDMNRACDRESVDKSVSFHDV